MPPEVLKPYLPHGVTLDLYREKAYVSLVGLCLKIPFVCCPFLFWHL
ncbi:MAG: DUF2071 domain-containing protein [Bacteroidetes bacterium]|nr:DUF2071 domain-containing protein [Bacteroidota bacterium]